MRSKRRARLRFTRKSKLVLLGCALVVIYALALVSWAGKKPHHDAVALPRVSATPSAQAPSSVPGSGSPSPSGSAKPGKLSDLLGAGNLPDSSLTDDPSGLPRHSVRIEVTSDGYIEVVGYKVLHGDPPEYGKSWVKSPFIAVTSGRSGGAVAYVVAESASNASHITCTLSVDGTVRSTHTVQGANKFTACLG
jgi:hypothetical protein